LPQQKNLFVNSTLFPTHKQIDHVLIDERQHSNIDDVKVADCDSGSWDSSVVQESIQKFPD